MGILQVEKGHILHRTGEGEVRTIELLIKGRFKISNQYSHIYVEAGGFIGIVETPGKPYVYTCEAVEPSTLYSYPFESVNNIPDIVRSNPKIAPVLAASSADNAAIVCAVYEKQFDDALKEYDRVISEKADYPSLCLRAGIKQKDFPDLDVLIPPEKSGKVPNWVFDFAASLKENSISLQKTFYPMSTELACGMVMTTYTIYKTISDESVFLNEYRRQFQKRTLKFQNEMKIVHKRIEELEAAESGSVPVEPAIVGALETILTYSGVSSSEAESFRENIAQFKANSNRYGSSDKDRALRKAISSSFYDIYLSCFLHSLTDDDIPAEIRMFFMFGFVDEELAGESNTRLLLNILKCYVPDPEGNVLTIYEWLKKIYFLEVKPSRNEFDQDYETYIREQRITGALDEQRASEMISNPLKRLDYEIRNFFSFGNRMCFGRISSFVPVFDQQNVLRPLDMAYVSTAKINEYIYKIRNVDFGLFYRESLYSNPEAGLNHTYYKKEISPYIILMPGIGSRGCMWQEIEGRDRQTKGRIIISVFNTESTEDIFIKLLADFRWEMCKAQQGMYWNDITYPSLTSRYSDYLQYYRKNRQLSSENKEKIKTDLKKHSGNFKKLFIADYLMYIKSESTGSPRLNKVCREILFGSCPFSRQIRNNLRDNPLYSKMISGYNADIDTSLKHADIIVGKLKKSGFDIPDELAEHIKYLNS